MAVFLYSIFAYIIGLIGQIWFILYLGDWEFITNIHRHQNSLTIYAILVDTLLVLIFALQHSVMARDWFKSKINKIIPSASERATYVLSSGMALILIVLYWQPIDGSSRYFFLVGTYRINALWLVFFCSCYFCYQSF